MVLPSRLPKRALNCEDAFVFQFLYYSFCISPLRRAGLHHWHGKHVPEIPRLITACTVLVNDHGARDHIACAALTCSRVTSLRATAR